MCFVGHGAFGIITKESWVRYFAVVGIGRDSAYALMPLVGTLDVSLGILALVVPVPIIGWWMIAWTIWTAMLRPLAGESVFEAFERAGNYGAPAALLLLMSHARSWRGLFKRGFLAPTPDVARRLEKTLTAAVALLLVGHGALGVIGKAGLVDNYASVMPPSMALWLTPRLGWFEIALALAVVVRPAAGLLLFIVGWKLLTEGLYVSAGSPIWEFIERGGSYAAPLALAVLIRSAPRHMPSRLTLPNDK